MRFLVLSMLALALCAGAHALTVCRSAPVYEPCEIEFELSEAEAAAHSNPYLSVVLRAEFRSPKKGSTMVIPGFWDGGRRFKIRFSPMAEGRWDFRIISNLESVNRKVDSFEAVPAVTPGFVRVFNFRYFRYDRPDTAHFWMGDTSYRFATIPRETFQSLVDVRSAQKFNHIRGLVLGSDASAQRVLADPNRIDPEYFQEVDRRVAYMNQKGITYDLILAGDQNQLADLLPKRKQRERYVRYLVARYAAMNITWQGVQEYEEYKDGAKLLRELGGYLKKMDPYQHPRSTHAVTTSGGLVRDGWMDYIVQQSSSSSLAAVEYEMYPMPIVNAEFGYEDSGAGKSHDHHVDTGTFRRRLWNAALHGQYVTFGNTGTYGGRKFDVNARFADSPGARQMTYFYDFFTQTRYWDLESYPRVAGGPALALELTRYRSETMQGIEYIVYVEKPGPVELRVSKGKYDVSWFNPVTGEWLHQKDKFKGERFISSGPPDATHDWVLYVRREGKKQGMNRSYHLESRRPKPKEIESAVSEVPFRIQLPSEPALVAGQSYEFNATLTKDTVASKRMRWLWTVEVPGSGAGYRVLATRQFGHFKVPSNLTLRYPATLQVRLLGVDGLRRIFESFKTYTLVKQ